MWTKCNDSFTDAFCKMKHWSYFCHLASGLLVAWCLCFRLCLGYWPFGFLVHCWFSCSLVCLVVRYDNTVLPNLHVDLFTGECKVYFLKIVSYCLKCHHCFCHISHVSCIILLIDNNNHITDVHKTHNVNSKNWTRGTSLSWPHW